MLSLIMARLGRSVFTLWFAITLIFFVLRILPGSAIEAQLHGSGLPPETMMIQKARFGLDQPVIIQYFDYLYRLFEGDLGVSLYTSQPVIEILNQRYSTTLKLVIPAIVLMIVLGLSIGLLAHHPLNLIRKISHASIDLSLGMPVYWTATLTLFVLSIRFGNHLLLPILVLGFHSSGVIARLVYRQIADYHNAPYILAAHGRGLTKHRMATHYLLLPALPPILSVIGVQMGILFGGTVFTEAIFSQSGIGVLLLNAVIEQNYPVVQGIMIIVVMIYIIINMVVDILNLWLDPRLGNV